MHHSLQIYLQLVSCCELHIYMIKSHPSRGGGGTHPPPVPCPGGWGGGVCTHPLGPMSWGGDEYSPAAHTHPRKGPGTRDTPPPR